MLTAIISLCWKLLCLVFLIVQVKWYREYHLSRPLVWISLADLVIMDLVWHYLASCIVFFLIIIPLELGLTLSNVLAQCLVLLWSFHIHCTLMSLTAIVLVRYMHSRRKTTGICVVFNDVEASIFIRLEIAAISMIFQSQVLTVCTICIMCS